tara:strand:+ start:1900 stop:2136 length:237 start_codon:yes stop_codon:yes gene_type:complete
LVLSLSWTIFFVGLVAAGYFNGLLKPLVSGVERFVLVSGFFVGVAAIAHYIWRKGFSLIARNLPRFYRIGAQEERLSE